jgi:hypothetical protein
MGTPPQENEHGVDALSTAQSVSVAHCLLDGDESTAWTMLAASDRRSSQDALAPEQEERAPGTRRPRRPSEAARRIIRRIYHRG